MLNRLTTASLEVVQSKIAELLSQNVEWFFTLSEANSPGKTEALNRSELDVSVAHQRLILTCWTEQGIRQGSRAWKIFAWDWTGEKLILQVSRRMGAERPLIELVPRASATSIALTVKTARQKHCDLLANLACSLQPGARVERAALSPGARRGQPGRYARIILRQRHQRIAVTGCIASSKASDADAFLSAALLWFTRAGERTRAPYIQQLWLVVENVLLKPTLQRIALLREALRQAIVVYEDVEGLTQLRMVEIPTRADLWKKRTPRFPPIPVSVSSELTKTIIAAAPDAIDIVSARHGQTLRYFGLPFARVRQLLGAERVWFGVEGSRRRMLDETSEDEWVNLISSLVQHRSAGAADHYHALYRNAGEAWLESLLRRDITRLDPGLIIAPVHAQFRTARRGVTGVRPVDLLALRHDGRLVVIELKVSEAREHVLQGADYWHRVEAHRRRWHISRAKLFGDRKITDEPPLIYLVAPTLRVHPSFNTLARAIAADIEIYRFDINEDWRAGVRVMRRMRVN